TTYLAGSSSAFPVWLKLARSGATVTGSVSSDGVNWSAVGSTQVSATGGVASLVVTSHDPSLLNTATFDNVAVASGSGVPTPWTSGDVGATGVAGTASYGAGTFTVRGAGADVWGSADAFQFVSQPLAGDGQIIARVASLQNTSAFAKAGVMIRATR